MFHVSTSLTAPDSGLHLQIGAREALAVPASTRFDHAPTWGWGHRWVFGRGFGSSGFRV